MADLNQEERRLLENENRTVYWKKWGPYLSERQWGTIREDYSADGEAWDYFPHDHARSRAYRWGEDGLAGICETGGDLCFALALWNGKDPILKERLYGLSGKEGNHGEDVKELYYYLDNTPSHSYMKYLYKYPQAEYPYRELLAKNQAASRLEPERELLDTGILNGDKYFDVYVEYAKSGPADISIKIEITNRGADLAELALLPTLWFRNTWAFGKTANKPSITADKGGNTLTAKHEALGSYYLYSQGADDALFTENETNTEKLYGVKNKSPYVKDAFHEVIVNGRADLLKDKKDGTKAAFVYNLKFKPGETRAVYLRLAKSELPAGALKNCPGIVAEQKKQADIFYSKFDSPWVSADLKNIQRQAFAGLLWNKQYYNYEMEVWQKGDKGQPEPPAGRRGARNSGWEYLFNRDIISMPDKWEYPWYATWDLAFHCVTLALVDPAFAKSQLLLFLREWYMHPNGQLPAYEWALRDVNPPVHAWACYEVYKIEKEKTGKGDLDFLKRAFNKLLINFTWWVNQKDKDGHNIFQGGFLGLDNIGIFDRNQPLPTGGHLEQSDGTSWMAMYSLNMMTIALELAARDSAYEDMASKFFEHFARISEAFNNLGDEQDVDLWDKEDGFFYDAIHFEGKDVLPLKVRSLVGLIPLLATRTLDASVLKDFPGFAKRLLWFRENRKKLEKQLIIEKLEGEEKILFSLVKKDRLVKILEKMLDEGEFLAPGGIRALSKYHERHPFTLEVKGSTYAVGYQPGESDSGLFGGNSNWRGPVWLPLNYLLIKALMEYHSYYKDTLTVEYPAGSGGKKPLGEVAVEIARRNVGVFALDGQGRRPVHDGAEFYEGGGPCGDLVLFYEYIHGDTSRGVGASHQTGWTALVANLIDECAMHDEMLKGEGNARPALSARPAG
ncbi:MAG: glucosidase [Elusimicrobiota bacterium]|nr:glucosidase [Elusimicrobiota bacterium]